MDIFQNLNDQGLTIVLVTHESDIAQFAKRVLVFRDGKIRKDDPVSSSPGRRNTQHATNTRGLKALHDPRLQQVLRQFISLLAGFHPPQEPKHPTGNQKLQEGQESVLT